MRLLANELFSMIFIIEMVVKLLGFGIKGYVSDSFNIFDGSLVIINLVDIVVTAIMFQESEFDSSAMQSFRTIRLLRIIKLIRGWPAL